MKYNLLGKIISTNTDRAKVTIKTLAGEPIKMQEPASFDVEKMTVSVGVDTPGAYVITIRDGAETTSQTVSVNETSKPRTMTEVATAVVEEKLATVNNTLTVPGPKGDPGAAGTEGPMGPMGPMGPKGPDGLDGTNGVDGLRGPQGERGLRGLDGPTGPAGGLGPVGPEGPEGPRGLAGDPGIGIKGDQGATGPDGPQGQQGLRGPQGIKGDPGLDGAPGVKGTDGTPGSKGSQGDPGPKGDQGIQGLKGDTGPAGSYTGPALRRTTVSTPAMVFVLSPISSDVAITWSSPMPNTNYSVFLTTLTDIANLLGKTSVVLKPGSRTTTGCIATVTSTVTLAVGQVTIDALAITN